MYCFESKVRYSETGADGKMTLQSILNYFQDASTFQSEELGVGIEFLSQHNLIWVLSAWQIVVERYPELMEEIKIVTFPYEFKGFLGFRNFYMEDQGGEKIAYANSIWTLMDLQAGRPVRPLAEMVETYRLEEKLPMEYAPRKIAVSQEGKKGETVVVKNYHLDSNNHVNNGQYIRMAIDAVDEMKSVHQMRAEYKKSAVLGDIIVPYVNREEGRYTIELTDEKREPFAIVELAR